MMVGGCHEASTSCIVRDAAGKNLPLIDIAKSH